MTKTKMVKISAEAHKHLDELIGEFRPLKVSYGSYVSSLILRLKTKNKKEMKK